jgi:hypothetical protein
MSDASSDRMVWGGGIPFFSFLYVVAQQFFLLYIFLLSVSSTIAVVVYLVFPFAFTRLFFGGGHCTIPGR